ncbi:LysR family transcriptional regulator [uncultured Cetobacterium sp.]|uniref:LysR family transcriptional regulator n=1 Tax=uncultured Cetobacterium sp. TaxID=527638 RepID=UPI0026228344|nr:LysR family transcriptional regulator [uncultured Cetobacterium sp.]
MDLNKFEYILCVAEEKSFTKAASKLYISQPALSQYVASLEEQLKVKLFDRSVTPLKLTLGGEIFIKKALEILQLKKELWRELHDISSNLVGNISIGISPNRSLYLLPYFFKELKDKFPNIKVEIIERNSKELEKGVLDGMVDIAIISLPLTSLELEYIKFFEEELFLISSKERDYSNKLKENIVAFELLKNENFILLKEKQKLRTLVEVIFLKNNFIPKIYLETESQECVLEMISLNMGIGFTSNMILNNSKWKEKFNKYSLKENNFKRDFAIVFKKGKKLNNVEKEFINIIQEKFKSF